jgi:hypothetical protein
MTPIAEEFQSASLRIGFPQKYTEVSALGQKATFANDRTRSASPPRTDIGDGGCHACFVSEMALLSHFPAS